jgi:hypothetical protein
VGATHGVALGACQRPRPRGRPFRPRHVSWSNRRGRWSDLGSRGRCCGLSRARVRLQVWSSHRWPVGPKGYAHPPAARSVGDLEAFGEQALVAAWRQRVPPPPRDANRFALGVESPRKRRLPPPMPDKPKQKFSPVRIRPHPTVALGSALLALPLFRAFVCLVSGLKYFSSSYFASG